MIPYRVRCKKNYKVGTVIVFHQGETYTGSAWHNGFELRSPNGGNILVAKFDKNGRWDTYPLFKKHFEIIGNPYKDERD